MSQTAFIRYSRVRNDYTRTRREEEVRYERNIADESKEYLKLANVQGANLQ